LSNYVVTEAGFGADLGAEKFFHIKCAQSDLKPDAVVLVATIRALKHHAGLTANEFKTENVQSIEKGFCNLEKHIENIQKFGINPIVCINAFPEDYHSEYEKLIELCATKGVKALVSTAFAEGGKGSALLAETVISTIETASNNYHTLYNPENSITEKIEIVAKEIYGASNVNYTNKAQTQLKMINELGFNQFSVCMAKTPMSFSDDEKKIGRPTDFTITIREFEISSGAGFIVPLLGDVMRMPGLPAIPNAERIDIDSEGKIYGLS